MLVGFSADAVGIGKVEWIDGYCIASDWIGVHGMYMCKEKGGKSTDVENLFLEAKRLAKIGAQWCEVETVNKELEEFEVGGSKFIKIKVVYKANGSLMVHPNEKDKQTGEWTGGTIQRFRGLSEFENAYPDRNLVATFTRPITLHYFATKSVCDAMGGKLVDSSESEFEQQPELDDVTVIGTGTGFLVNQDYIVTADHVLEDCYDVSVRHGHNEHLTQIAARDTGNDLGLLMLEKPINASAKLRSGKPIRLGDVIATYGYPLSGTLSDSAKITQGNVNSLAGLENDSRVFQYDASTQPGNSGGPVLDESGNIVGVVSHRYTEESNVNFAVKSSLLENFLAANNVDFEEAESTEELKLPDIAEKAGQFTVLVACWGESVETATLFRNYERDAWLVKSGGERGKKAPKTHWVTDPGNVELPWPNANPLIVKFIGDTKNGVPHGSGSEYVPTEDGDVKFFEGKFRNGLRNGAGDWVSPVPVVGFRSFSQTGIATYDGEWKNGTWHGQGTYTWNLVSNGESDGGDERDQVYMTDIKSVGHWRYGMLWLGVSSTKDLDFGRGALDFVVHGISLRSKYDRMRR